jgi:hypothetical protein
VKCLVAVVVLGGVAHADDAADPAAEQAGEEANLEVKAPRDGTTFSVAGGGSLALGFGIDDSVGRGGALSLRLGHVMTPSSVLLLELAGASQFHKVSMTSTVHNDDTHALIGAQYYSSPSLWFRAGVGYGSYHLVQASGDRTLRGVASIIGAGIDILRRHYFVLGIEYFSTATLNKEGVITSSALCLGASYY